MIASDEIADKVIGRKTSRHLALFLIFGIASTVFDFLSYHLMLLFISIPFAKGGGYLIGTTFSIFANYRWNFIYYGRNARRIVAQCCALYAIALLMNVAANSGVLALLGTASWALGVAFATALILTTTFNFVGMKLVIFRKRIGEASAP